VSQVSAVTTCKGRLAHLRQTLPLMMALPLREVVVVDYDCPEGAGAWVAEAFPQAKLVSVTDRPHFNVSAARNLGAAAASAPWLLFVDADTCVTPGLWDAIARRLAPGVFIVAQPRTAELCGTFVTARSDFDALEGFDEIFEGWGGEDTDFLERLEMLGRRRDFYDASLASSISHGHDLRMRHHRAADPHRTGLLNNLYRSAKNDLARQGVRLDAAGRQNLYAQLRSAFEREAPARSYEVRFRQRLVSGLVLTASLKYELSPPGSPPAQPAASTPGSAEHG